MIPLRKRLEDLGITGDVEQQQIMQEVAWWLGDYRKYYIEKQDITKYQTLPETYQWIESRVKFIDQLLKDAVLDPRKEEGKTDE